MIAHYTVWSFLLFLIGLPFGAAVKISPIAGMISIATSLIGLFLVFNCTNGNEGLFFLELIHSEAQLATKMFKELLIT